jgi:hypothetical protein
MQRTIFFFIVFLAMCIVLGSTVQAQDNRGQDVKVGVSVRVQVPMETRVESHTTYQSFGNVKAYTTYPGCEGRPNSTTPHPYRHSRPGPVCRQPVQIFEIGVK